MDEVHEQFRVLYNKVLCDLYRLSSFIRLEKSKRPKWTGHVSRMEGDKECIKNFVRQNIL
jgi:hypothetical protein